MSKLQNNQLEKSTPENILSTLSYVDYEIFPFHLSPVSNEEMLRILSIFIRTGKNFKEIRKDLIDIADGKTNELSDFVKSYPRKNNNTFVESFVMIFLGFFVAFCLFKGLVLTIF